jgi:heme exporter protein CcmD
MTHLQTFLHMGGYGGFVWPSYAAMGIILFVNVYSPLRRFRRLKGELRGKL